MNYSELSKVNQESKKYLMETRNLENPRYVHYLKQTRKVLQSLFLSLGSNEKVQFASFEEKIKFLKEYKEFIRTKNNLFPRFVFDDFDAKKFDKCVQYKEEGHTLLQTEEYYIKKLQKGKTF